MFTDANGATKWFSFDGTSIGTPQWAGYDLPAGIGSPNVNNLINQSLMQQ